MYTYLCYQVVIFISIGLKGSYHMKCPKCGYVSFDYLDTCKKCGNDLTSVRAILGLVPVIPNPPFLLSSLVGGEGVEAQPAETTPESSEEISLDTEELDITLETEVGEKPEIKQ